MFGWDRWKAAFDAWEGTTAEYLEQVLQSPVVLWPSGLMLSAAMKARAKVDAAAAQAWGNLGLPTKRDQERSLHALNQIQSQLLDLEEQLLELREQTEQP